MSGVALKHLCTAPPKYGLNVSPDRYRAEGGVRLLRTGDVNSSGVLDVGGGVFLDPSDVPPEYHLRTGDLLFSRSGTIGRALLFDESVHGEATFAGFLVRFRLKADVDPRALRYWSESASFLATIEAGAIQSTIANFNAEKYAGLEVPSRVVEHSVAVADYLDVETSRLDLAIALRRRQLELLRLREESILERHIEPLYGRHGAVPLKAVALLRFSSVDKKSVEGEDGVLLCNYTDVYYNRRIDKRLPFMAATASLDQIRSFSLRAGDVLLTKDSETAEDIAVSALVVEDLPGVVLSYHLAMLRPTAIDGQFLSWALRTRRCRDAFSLAASGVTRFGLRQDAVGRVLVPAVSSDVAASVVNEVERAVGSTEELIRLGTRQVDLLLEHRQALITSVIDGEAPIRAMVRAVA
jgi:type I restriction enzyme S subunit